VDKVQEKIVSECHTLLSKSCRMEEHIPLNYVPILCIMSYFSLFCNLNHFMRGL
jgi:hypothetical protein